jgi:hypothetical protein
MVCVTYIQQIYFLHFYLFILFCLKKNEIRVKPGHLQQIKKIMGLSFKIIHIEPLTNTVNKILWCIWVYLGKKSHRFMGMVLGCWK